MLDETNANFSPMQYQEKLNIIYPTTVVHRRSGRKIVNEDIEDEITTSKVIKKIKPNPQIHTGSTVMKIKPLRLTKN